MEKYSNGTSCLSGELCSVTHPIVSQVNPHVHLFFFAPQGSAGKPVAHRRGKGKGSSNRPIGHTHYSIASFRLAGELFIICGRAVVKTGIDQELQGLWFMLFVQYL
jgi:hypothetical protein